MPSNEINIMMAGAKEMNRVISEQFSLQGHTLTGAAERSLQSEISETGTSTDITCSAVDYMSILDEGVEPDKIPYARGSGAKTSKYIQGLIRYVELRMGKTGEEAKRIAFGIAETHKKEGMPSGGSSRFSATGKRKDFLEDAFKDPNNKTDIIISNGLDEMMEEQFSKQQNETV